MFYLEWGNKEFDQLPSIVDMISSFENRVMISDFNIIYIFLISNVLVIVYVEVSN